MPEVQYRNRRAVQLENDLVRVTVLVEGGHIAEILHKASGVNPLWTPPWPSIEPSTYDRERHPEYGSDAESKLLSGLMGHNLCLDLFGGPSPEEAAAGMTVHGEASIVPYSITLHGENKDGENKGGESKAGGTLIARATLPVAQLAVERRILLPADDLVLQIQETVENLSSLDRPAAWTEHVTMGPPFLERGVTQLRTPATQARTAAGVDFNWPHLPHAHGASEDLRVYTSAPVSGGFTTQLMDPRREQAFFLTFSPRTKLLFGYAWKRADFPWLGLWEENHSRKQPPWNGQTMTRGLEFGASPFPESRRQMIERHQLFNTPCYRWIPARGKVSVEYCAFIFTTKAQKIPESVRWNGRDTVELL